ncbi:helix-turn-helix domain-containing protein [Megamonas hypermegale]|uniref:helix-turn-helix domain-containing protein n=1 Tax=Megamonas hypermegale TaxID=158847 RepID=UPI0025A4052B|nr:helix-turn-helix domain-containing protein [Megamonas hypermegale]MDM8143741.1 helix-turn-helix domain-containing protein [Megamonas hypermegale]
MSDIGKRIRLLRKSLGLNQTDFGKPLGLKQAIIGQYETGVRNITDRNIGMLCKTYNINKDWLLTGEGEMENKNSNMLIEEISQTQNLTELDIQFLKKYLKLSTENRKLLANLLMNMEEKN